jgi:hypothetical protein
MPTKGTRKINPKGIQPRQHVSIPKELHEELERLAVVHGLINPRNQEGNRSKLIELATRAFRVFCRYYSTDTMPYPEKLADYLVRRARDGDTEAQEHLDYLESWSVKQSYDELVAESTIKLGDSYIL